MVAMVGVDSTAMRLRLRAQGCRFGYPGVTESKGWFNRNAVASTGATRSGLIKDLLLLTQG